MEGKMSGNFVRNLSGFHAKALRGENSSSAQLKESLAKSLPDVQVSELEVSDLHKRGSGIKEKFKFEANNGQEVIGDMIYFKPLFFETLTENPFKANEREYPIFFDFPSKKHNVVNIMIPEGYEVESMPKSQVIQLMENSGQFKYIISQNHSFIRVDMLLEISQSVFPVSNYEFLKKFFSSIIEKQNESIVLRKIKEDELGKRTESGR